MYPPTPPLVLLALALSSRAAANYIGCFSKDVLDGRTPTDIASTGVDCQTTCGQQNHIYSYQLSEDYGTPSYKLWCLCTDDAPNPEYLIDGCHNSSEGTSDLTVIIPYQLAYHFVWYNCHTFSPNTPGIIVGSARDCFATCNPYSWAGVVYDPQDPNLITCRCYDYNDHPWYGTPATACLPGAWFIYNHFPQPSGALKRRLGNKMEDSSRNGLCPHGLIACNVLNGDGLAYEMSCIDTDQELESCGGCRYGTFLSTGGNNDRSADCSAMEVLKLGGATCHKGVCLVTQSQDGYTLNGNRCVQI